MAKATSSTLTAAVNIASLSSVRSSTPYLAAVVLQTSDTAGEHRCGHDQFWNSRRQKDYLHLFRTSCTAVRRQSGTKMDDPVRVSDVNPVRVECCFASSYDCVELRSGCGRVRASYQIFYLTYCTMWGQPLGMHSTSPHQHHCLQVADRQAAPAACAIAAQSA